MADKYEQIIDRIPLTPEPEGRMDAGDERYLERKVHYYNHRIVLESRIWRDGGNGIVGTDLFGGGMSETLDTVQRISAKAFKYAVALAHLTIHGADYAERLARLLEKNKAEIPEGTEYIGKAEVKA